MRLLLVAALVIMTGCASPSGDGLVTAKVKTVEQVPNYTYLQVKAKGPAYWVAIPTTEIAVGSVISYRGGMLMEDFHSEELDRTFEKVLFLEGLEGGSASGLGMMSESTQGSKVNVEKLNTSVAVEGSISNGEIFADPGKFDGKTIIVSGEVAKYNPAIMERNWIHVQDGTEFEGKYDLTVTSSESFEVGQVISLQGTIALNRDFGYG
ncbi:MAG: hypothetical protein E4H10_16255, partial [Bacteroidia bacterium]